jgi:hypothetical protein
VGPGGHLKRDHQQKSLGACRKSSKFVATIEKSSIKNLTDRKVSPAIQFEIVVWEGKLRRAEDIRALRQIMASMDMWVVIEVLMTIQAASHFFNVLWLFFSHQAGHFFADR